MLFRSLSVEATQNDGDRGAVIGQYRLIPVAPSVPAVSCAAFFKESSPIRIAFNLLYLLKHGMVTTEQKEGKCVEHVLSGSHLIKTLYRKSELPRVSGSFHFSVDCYG